jgi:hypothetical protein
MTEISVPIPTDSDGYLRRQCPTCDQQFKWHHGPVDDAAASAATPPLVYYCPLCGASADVDSWWTTEQIEYAQEAAMPDILQQLEDEIPEITVELPPPPAELVEPNDMQVVIAPCHAYEPVKVPESQQQPFHCLVCGDRYVA